MMLLRGLLLLSLGALGACTSVTIDEYRSGREVSIGDGEQVVVLGRRHSTNYETEPTLVRCISRALESGQVPVVPENQFVDALYPWFEPRTAPLKVRDLDRLLMRKFVARRIEEYNIRYIVWVDGSTETTDSAGSIGCSIGAGGAGCFGFGTWDKESDYEATIWDYRDLQNLGQISADAEGTSYMPAVVVPIPIIARVQNNACKAMAAQLVDFFKPEGNASDEQAP